MTRIFALVALVAVLTAALDCAPDSPDGLQAACWDELKMTDYINNWVKTEGPAAGIEEKGFAQAYLAWSGRNGDTCNLITSNTCDKPDTDPKLYKDNQQFYTLWNIWSVWQFHIQFTDALTSSQSLAATKLGQIVDKVAPPVEKVVGTPEWYTMFTTMLLAITLFAAAGITGAPPLVAGVTMAVVNSLWLVRGTPPMGQVIQGYTQTAQDRFTTLADVGGDLADLVAEYKGQLAEEVKTMLNHAESFVVLCGQGGFSQRVELSLDDQSTALYRVLELFVLSESLTASGVIVAKSRDVDPRTVAKNTNQITCSGFGPAGNCYTWWFDPENGNTYAFHDINNDQRDFTDLINWIWEEGIVTDMKQIFAQEHCSGKNIDLPHDADLNQVCAVNIKNCEYAYDRHWDVQTKKQFTNCDNDPKWMEGCGDTSETTFVLPLSYLGPLLHEGAYCRTSRIS